MRRSHRPDSFVCDCQECDDVRAQSTLSQADLAMLDAHADERVDEYIGRRTTLELPKGVIVLAMFMLLVVLGWYSWQAQGAISGAAIGLALLVNGWTGGMSYARMDERRHRRSMEYENSRLRMRISELQLDGEFKQHGSTALKDAAFRVVSKAKIRQEDLHDEGDDFMYEVPSAAMMQLSDALEGS